MARRNDGNVTRLRVAIATVGCRANQADSAALARALGAGDVEIVASPADADVAVVNTCCVTAEAERDSRKAVRRALGASRGARVVITGCAVSAIRGFGEGFGPRARAVGGGDTDIGEVAAFVGALTGSEDPEPGEGGRPVDGTPRRERALLKVQTGCCHGCAYCVVPAARGPERSMPIGEAVSLAASLFAQGYPEIVLTGVQLGAWGQDLPGSPRLAALVAALADRAAPGRVRLSSIEPWSVDDELLDVVAGHDRVCPHLHLPLQSGCDRVLAAMGRPYDGRGFLGIARAARSRRADLALGTDVLLGFPGEDEAAFADTIAVLEEARPAYLHAFGFSPRPGTRACSMPGRPSRDVVRGRVRETRALGDAARAAFFAAQEGVVREVAIEARVASGLRGLTDNFVPVNLRGGDAAPGSLVHARLRAAVAGGRLEAELILRDDALSR
jgi:threonylcarbamoyladenosine tRNA methylthiotransferase MtaB